MFLRGVGTRMHTMKVLKGHSNVLLLTLKSKKVPEVLGRKLFFLFLECASKILYLPNYIYYYINIIVEWLNETIKFRVFGALTGLSTSIFMRHLFVLLILVLIINHINRIPLKSVLL